MSSEEIRRAIRESGLMLSWDMRNSGRFDADQCISKCTTSDCNSGACATDGCKSSCNSPCNNSGCTSCNMATQ